MSPSPERASRRSRSRSRSLSSYSSSSSSSVRSDGSEGSFQKITTSKKDKSRNHDTHQVSQEPAQDTNSRGIDTNPFHAMHSGNNDGEKPNLLPEISIPQGGPGSSSSSSNNPFLSRSNSDSEKGIFNHHTNDSHPFHPPPYTPGGTLPSQIPPQGRRYQTKTQSPFPAPEIVGKPPFHDMGGEPIYVGSAIFPTSVHPCKLAPELSPVCRVPYGGNEFEHHGRYDLLPITPDMEWVPAKHGVTPKGRRPVDGGYEESGERLYHAAVVWEGVSVPGKCAPHLRESISICLAWV